MSQRIAWVCAVLLTVSACGGSGSSGGVQQPVAPPPAIDRVAVLDQAAMAFPVANYALIIGDADGPLLTREYGSFSIDDRHLIASASKWLTAMIIMSLVEQGVMSLDDQPQDYISWWSDDPADARSRITLEQLLAFTAGFDTGPAASSCVSDPQTTVDDCAREFHDGGLRYEPGTTFYYGPAHMQVAARMAELAAGQRYTDLVDLQLGATLGLSETYFRVPSASNPRASGGAESSASDYAKILRAILQGSFLSGVNDQLEQVRTAPPVDIASAPIALAEAGVEFRYALGHWRECTEPAWTASCENRQVASSTGAFGWHPWIDYDNGYYGVLAVFELEIDGSSPGSESIQFAHTLQPLIEAALADLRAAR